MAAIIFVSLFHETKYRINPVIHKFGWRSEKVSYLLPLTLQETAHAVTLQIPGGTPDFK